MKPIFIYLLLTGISFAKVSQGQITEIGLASFYADKFNGRVTASGAIFDQNKYTGAHRTFNFGTIVKVTNLKNNKSVTVEINDRGPFIKDRVIDLSRAAATELEFIGNGVTQVKVEVITLGKNTTVSTSNSSQSSKPSANSQIAQPESPKEIPVVTPPTTQESTIEFYQIETNKITPQGFGIQIASFQEAGNLMKQCDGIKKLIQGKELIIQVSETNNVKLYRIIIGVFDTRDAAANFNTKLNNQFKGSFIIPLP